MKNKAAVHLGRKGGKATFDKHGYDYLMKIAKKGGEARKKQILGKHVDKVSELTENAVNTGHGDGLTAPERSGKI